MSLSVTCSITLAYTEETPLTDKLARLVEIEASLLSNPSVQMDTCLAEVRKCVWRRWSMSSA